MSLPKHPSYKDSGVQWLGEVPEDWEIRPIKHIANLVNGHPFESNLFDAFSGTPLIRIRDLNKNKTEVFYKGEPIEAIKVTSQDLLIGMDGDFNVGRWLGEGTALLNQRMCCVRGHSNETTRLLEYALPIPLKLLNDLTYSTTVKHLATSQIEKTKIAIPQDRAELSCLLSFLDHETGKINALIAEQEKLLTLLAEKRLATISQAVTRGLNSDAPMKDSRVPWLGEVPAHWDVISLKRLIADGSSISYGIVQPGEPLEEGIPFIQTTNMTNGDFSFDILQKTSPEIAGQYPRSRLYGGEVLLGIRASIGAAHVVPASLAGCNLSRGIARIQPNRRLSSSYLVAYLDTSSVTNYWQINKQGSTFNEVSIETVRELAVTVPPIEEQLEIITFIKSATTTLDGLKVNAERAIALLKERRSALIAAAVTGKIDVRNLSKIAA